MSDYLKSGKVVYKRCCEEDPIDEFSKICQACYDEFRIELMEEQE